MTVVILEEPGSGPAAVSIDPDTALIQVQGCYDIPLLQRLYVLAPIVACAMIQEDPSTPKHSQRAAYARQVMADPTSVVNRSIVFVLVGDGITNPLSSDADIVNRLGDIWDNLSTGFA